jgi:RNA polymerase sigma-70 factor, ECF subfamily
VSTLRQVSEERPARSLDRDLARRAGDGDEAARRELAWRLLPRVRTTVHYLAAGDRDADDLVQQALVEVLRVVGTFRGDASLEYWADRVVVRTALRRIKQRRWRETIVRLDTEEPGATDAVQERSYERRELRQRLTAHLENLSVDRRTAVVLHWVRGYTISEIADLTGAKLNTIRGRLRDAKRQLRKQLLRDPVLREWAESIHDTSQ